MTNETTANTGAAASAAVPNAAPVTAKNVIFLLPDGFGPAADTGYRWFKGDGASEPVWADHLMAHVQTESANNPVTDSAASATAYATGVKTFNGGVGVDAQGNEVTSVLDIASQAGKATGIVSTAAIWDASPAAFAASTPNRSNAGAITQEYIDNNDLDVILGGGRAAFELDTDGDGRTTVQEAQAKGFDFITEGSDLAVYNGDKLLGLFNDQDLTAPIGGAALGERPNGEPTLAAMTQTALDVLQKDEDGFFLFVEEEGTDSWGHANDAATTFHSGASFEQAWQVALDYVEAHPNTLIVSVADHETGGMTLELSNTRLPSVFQSFEATYEAIGTAILEEVAGLGAGADQATINAAVNTVVSGFTSGEVTLSSAEIGAILGAGDEDAAYAALAETLNARGGIEFSTTGHTAIDVPLYAYGAGSDLFNGTLDNTAIAKLVAQAMGLNLPSEPTEPSPVYLRGTAGADTFDQSSATSRVLIAGLEGDDTLRGGAGSDALNGGAGNDVLAGGAGNDTITGGLGADRMSGGAGTDVFNIGVNDIAMSDATDLIVNFQGAGVDGSDVIRFTGFAAGSTLAMVDTSGNAMVYEVQDMAGVSEGHVLVSAGGAPLIAGDYVFA